MSVPTHLTFDEMKTLPPAQKSAIKRWYDGIQSSGAASVAARAKLHMVSAGHAVRQGGESLLVGGALAIVDVERGLDVDIQGRARIPIDGAVAAVGLLGGVVLAHEEVGVDLRNAGAAAAAIYGFRKTRELLAAKKAAAGKPVASRIAGEFDGGSSGDIGAEDPIIAAARMM